MFFEHSKRPELIVESIGNDVYDVLSMMGAKVVNETRKTIEIELNGSPKVTSIKISRYQDGYIYEAFHKDVTGEVKKVFEGFYTSKEGMKNAIEKSTGIWLSGML